MKGVIYDYDKPLPDKLHRFFIGYTVMDYIEENFDTRQDALDRIKELRKSGVKAQLFTRERIRRTEGLRL